MCGGVVLQVALEAGYGVVVLGCGGLKAAQAFVVLDGVAYEAVCLDGVRGEQEQRFLHAVEGFTLFLLDAGQLAELAVNVVDALLEVCYRTAYCAIQTMTPPVNRMPITVLRKRRSAAFLSLAHSARSRSKAVLRSAMAASMST